MKQILAATFFLAGATCSLAATVPRVPQYTEETGSSGIQSIYAGDYQYMVGGGAATFDCDDDGDPDLFLAGGEAKASLYTNRSRRGGALRFKKHISGLEFDKVTGAYPLDVDADGHMDLVVLRIGENKIMRGLGRCRFEEANKRWNFDGGDSWSSAYAATFEKGATGPTIAIGNYIDRTQEVSPWGSCTDNWLHRPNTEHKKPPFAFARPIALTPSYCPLSMLFTDWNRSGTPSLRVSNDREYYEGGEEQLWKILPNEAPQRFAPEEGWQRLRIWGMGIASADVNGDTFPDYFLTSMADHKLQILADPAQNKPVYKDLAYPKGITLHRPTHGDDLKTSTGWHAQFEDVNNDGLWDLFVAKGNVDQMPDFAQKDPNNLALGKPDGTFVDVAREAGVDSTETSRGGMVVDFNRDGLLDIVVVNRRTKAQIWRNTSKTAGQWLQVKLNQPGPNRNGIGAWVEVKRGDIVSRREITSGGGHASGHLGWWHFGLAQSTKAEVRVLWPDGTQGPWQVVKANGFYTLSPNDTPKTWSPGK